MAKTKTPFLSLGAQGSVGRSITAQRRNSATLLREKPLPADPYTLPQAYQRWLYEDYAYLWTLQNAATKQTYTTLGYRFHLTGFQMWMKAMLSTLPDIVAGWHLDERAGAVAIDFGKHSNNGTIIGATPAVGVIDYGQYFTVNDRITCGALPNWTLLNDMTIELFIKPTEWEDNRGIYFKSLVSYMTQLGAVESRFDARVYDSAGVQTRVSTSPGAPPDPWLHLAIVSELNEKLKAYINGIHWSADSPLARTLPIASNSNPFIIGFSTLHAKYFTGYIDHFVIYNRILDPTELKRHSERRYPAQ